MKLYEQEKCKECDNFIFCMTCEHAEKQNENFQPAKILDEAEVINKIKKYSECLKEFVYKNREICYDKKCNHKSSKDVCELNSITDKINYSDYQKIPCHCKMVEKFKDRVVYDFGEPFDIIDKDTLEKLLKRHEKQVKKNKFGFLDLNTIDVDLLDNITHELKNGELVEMKTPILNITVPTIIKFDKPLIQMKIDGVEKVLMSKTRKANSFEEINEYFKDKPLYYYMCYLTKTCDAETDFKDVWKIVLWYFDLNSEE